MLETRRWLSLLLFTPGTQLGELFPLQLTFQGAFYRYAQRCVAMVILNPGWLTVRIDYGTIPGTFLSSWLLLVYFPQRYQAGEE